MTALLVEAEPESVGMSSARLARIEQGSWLLPALPLYRRRPEAVPPVGMPR